jgi:hypothetical protein
VFMFIGVSNHTYMSIYVYTVFLTKEEDMPLLVQSHRNLGPTASLDLGKKERWSVHKCVYRSECSCMSILLKLKIHGLTRVLL